MANDKRQKASFTTAAGYTLQIESVNVTLMQMVQDAAKAQYLAEHPAPPKPTYTIETVGGGQEVHEHDASTADTPQLKAQLKAYEDAQAAAHSHSNDRVNEFLLLESIKSVDPVDDGAWVEHQKRWGIVAPDDPDERYLHFLKTVVVNPPELAELVSRVMALGGVDRQLVDAAVATFRNTPR